MPVTITKISGIGGNPPAFIQVEGTVSGCEKVYVTVSCSTDPIVPINIPSAGTHPWSKTFKNSNTCGCGTSVTASASCILGFPAADTQTVTLPLNCDDCPTATITVTQDATCVNGKHTVTLKATVTPPTGGPAFGQWDYGYAPPGGSSLGASFYVGSGPPQVLTATMDYPPSGPNTYTASLKLNKPPHVGCTDPQVTFAVTDCPPPSCEVLLTYSPNPVPCIGSSGSQKVDFVATLNPPSGGYTGPFTWEVKKGVMSLLKITQPTPAAPLNPERFSYVFTSPGQYDVTITILTASPCADPVDTDTVHIVIEACCPQLIGPLNASPIPGDPCRWLFSAQASNPNNVPVTFVWSFQDGTTATTSVPQTVHTYTPGAITTGMTIVTLKSPGCPDQSLSAPVTQMCRCPIIGTTGAVVTGCVPGPATVALTTSVTPPLATSFAWTVTTPGGTSFTKTTPAASTTDGTADGAWTDTSTGSLGVLNLGASGAYAVTVTAQGPSISPACPQSPARGFTVPLCTPPTTTCSIWCILAGIFFIAIPISAYISTVAHCLLATPWNIVLQGGIIATAIGIFIALCGICCLWRFLLIGSALGVVATVIAAIWLGFPGCWLLALPILIGFIALGIGMGASCKWR